MPFYCLNTEFLAKQRVRINNNRWLSWHDSGISEDEKRLILKLDVVILIYGCLVRFQPINYSHLLTYLISRLSGSNIW